MIYWKDTISIITRLFEIKGKDIAEQLGVSPQTISKVKWGWQEPPTQFAASIIYCKIFDPKAKGSQAFGCREESLLSDLRAIIEEDDKFSEVKKCMKDFWDEKDYKTFVMELLNRTRHDISGKNKSKIVDNNGKNISTSEGPVDSSSARDTLATKKPGTIPVIRKPEKNHTVQATELPKFNVVHREKNNRPQADSVASNSQIFDDKSTQMEPLEPMTDVFYQGFTDFSIYKFIGCDPVNSLSVDRIRDAVDFLGRIKTKQRDGNTPDKDTEVYKKIIEFADKLEAYLKFLKENSRAAKTNIPGMFYSTDFHPVNGNDDFMKETDRYRYRLKYLYKKKIKYVIKKQRGKHQRKLKSEGKNLWKSNGRNLF